MRRANMLCLTILTATAAAGCLMLLMQGMTFSLLRNWAPAGVAAVLAPAAMFYHQRNTLQFASTLTALIFVFAFISCFSVLMYAGAAFAAPLCDDVLLRCDRMLGVHLPSIVAWAEAHPAVSAAFETAYHSTLPQSLALVVLLGFSGQRRALEGHVLHLMLALLITGMIFCIAPAEGPFTAYGYEPSESQQRYLDHLHTLRSGERTEVVLEDVEGLVTFPSFHTTWAILLIFACRNCRRLFPLMIVLNLMVIAATLTTGWHYFTDVLGGAAVAGIVIYAVYRMQPWLYADEREEAASHVKR